MKHQKDDDDDDAGDDDAGDDDDDSLEVWSNIWVGGIMFFFIIPCGGKTTIIWNMMGMLLEC